jgi:hypothetical protein
MIRCVLPCMLEAVEGRLCLLEGMLCLPEDVGGTGDDALCTALYVEGCRRWALFIEGVGVSVGTGGDTLCAALYAGDCGECALLLEMSEVLELPEVMHCVLFCVLEAV